MSESPRPTGQEAVPAGPWPPRSAYLHIPFCHRRCFYCDFAVVPLGDRADGASSGSIARYLEQLLAEIAAAPDGPPLSTVYVGGGTPSMLTPAQLGQLLAALRARFGLAPGAELSLEMDPASFDQDRLAGYLAAGVNRVSLGGQSFDDAVLERLGRRHRRADLLQAATWLAAARCRGDLASWSLDLIQGLPGQDLAGWDTQLAQAIALAPPHLSVYDLIVEPGTVFERLERRGQLDLPDVDLAADLMEHTGRRLGAAGYGHYEISNYAWPGHASRHNRVYWSGAGWWGFGLGATSAPWGERLARPRTREAYGAWLAEAPFAAGDSASPGMPFDERVLVGLRRREGVRLERLAAAAGLGAAELAPLLERWRPYRERGLLRAEGGRWRLSDPEGLALSNAVLRELLEWWEERDGLDRPGE
ncbi:radical SAM family heme chaperone HemW [Vulcanococcus limneticus Candia 3F8]|uniref:radical SAM family heme chaperone HemW n=1 Tax=Vulcanococcus limneticus TaxID=2170428 RepID=UPI000B98631D|nr:radical SAM family heme chaperone HemW [Vulcanococcus limneticus]MCP9790880.1 radical SAM family heme chaperone HemW [Vulcanococcus limneticus MW73D5]MCP9892777.1 radical SAM family heme chaperone HemW [Vulcanococcus limneticus Candia 3F8]MCP9896487.1 radical SAM family heme chaperone HemW [Vulcanococcus limneticus Candia 3B3]